MPAVRSQKRHVGSFGGFFLGIFVKKITALSWAGMPIKRTRLDLIFRVEAAMEKLDWFGRLS
jgi:hypothetical protein